MNFKFLDYLAVRDGLLVLSFSGVQDISHARTLVSGLEKMFIDLSKFSNKGYINDPRFNIPIVESFIKRLGIIDGDFVDCIGVSVVLNTLYYNLILILMKEFVVIIGD